MVSASEKERKEEMVSASEKERKEEMVSASEAIGSPHRLPIEQLVNYCKFICTGKVTEEEHKELANDISEAPASVLFLAIDILYRTLVHFKEEKIDRANNASYLTTCLWMAYKYFV